MSTSLGCAPPRSKAEILELLLARGGLQLELHTAAREARTRYWRGAAVVRGLVKVNNVCRSDCNYCSLRRGNTVRPEAYLLTPDEIVEAARRIQAAGWNVVFLESGELPETTEVVGNAIPLIKELFSGKVELLLSLGNKTLDEYAYLRKQGADGYILRFETGDPDLHGRLRHQILADRLACLETLSDLGFKTGTGMIAGLPGQSIDGLAEDLLLAEELEPHSVSVLPFVPVRNTPLQDRQPAKIDVALNAIATLRLMGPQWLIPCAAELEALQPDAQFLALQAGGNVLTVDFTPPEYDSGSGLKPEHARELLARTGLENRGSCWLL